MYKQVFITMITLLFVLTGNAQEVKKMSLDEAIAYALEHNPNVVSAQLGVEIADGRVSQNIATGMPQISGNIDLANNFELPTSFLPNFITPSVYGVLLQEGLISSEPPTSSELVPVQFGTKYSGSATLTLNQMIFDGSFFVGLDAAKAYKDLTGKELEKAKIDIAEAVSKAYYSVLVSEYRMELLNKNYGRLDTLLRETTQMYENGFAEKIDMNRSKVQFNNIKVEKENSEKLLGITRSNLKILLGLTVNDSLELTDVLSADMFDKEAENDFQYTDRIEYSILQSNQQLAMLDKKLNNSRYLPKLDLYATVGANLGTGVAANIFDITNEWYEFGVIGLRMNIPIFDGLQKHYINQQKKLQLEQIDQSFDQMQRSMDLEVRDTKVKLDNAIAYLKAQKENMEISEEVYNVTKEKYEQGVGSNLEVINADADFKEAQTNFFVALYSAVLAKIDYKKSIGKLL
ncbi:MAG: TolC family protein [Cyclobacteriaceae bacterium]|nr:TolC family protein [Cyclobacteriaceae bacterium]